MARFRPMPVDECRAKMRIESGPPAWWQPTQPSLLDCYTARPFDGTFASNEAWITYDRSSETLHFYYRGVD